MILPIDKISEGDFTAEWYHIDEEDPQEIKL